MTKFEELVNDYTLVGDDGAVIFSSFDQFLEFVEEIRQMEREACVKECASIQMERSCERHGYDKYGDAQIIKEHFGVE